MGKEAKNRINNQQKKQIIEAGPQMTQKLGLADKEFEITVINRLKKIEEKMGKQMICNLCETHFMYKDKEMLKVKGCKKDKTCQYQTNKQKPDMSM